MFNARAGFTAALPFLFCFTSISYFCLLGALCFYCLLFIWLFLCLYVIIPYKVLCNLLRKEPHQSSLILFIAYGSPMRAREMFERLFGETGALTSLDKFWRHR